MTVLSASDCPELSGVFMCSAIGEERAKRPDAFKDMETFFEISTKYVNRSGSTLAIYKINGKNYLENHISQQGLEGIIGKRLNCDLNKISLSSLYVYEQTSDNVVVKAKIKREIENGEHPLGENVHIEKMNSFEMRILKELEDGSLQVKLECTKI